MICFWKITPILGDWTIKKLAFKIKIKRKLTSVYSCAEEDMLSD